MNITEIFKDLWRFNVFDALWTNISQIISESSTTNFLSITNNTSIVGTSEFNTSIVTFDVNSEMLTNVSHSLASELEINATHDILCSPTARVFAALCSAEGRLYLFGGRDEKLGDPFPCPFLLCK